MMRQRHSARAGLLCSTALTAAALALAALPAAAQPAPGARPTGGQVVAGVASIGQSASTTTITQATPRAAVNWTSFDVGSQQAVVFQQPSASAVTLNRVTTPNPSAIAGRITANGSLVIVNQSGVVFTPGAQVDAQGVIVAAPGITNRNFMAGRMVFDQPGQANAAVVNQGTLTVRQAGLAALVAPQVANSGVINARLGHVVLAGAAAATLDLYGDGLVSIDVTKQVTQTPAGPDGKPVTVLVTNTGTVRADGGTVQITAAAADGVVQTLVQAGGRIQADSVGTRTGTVVIEGTGGSLVVDGAVLARGRADGTTGGQIELAATGSVTVAPAARVLASGRAGGGTVAVGTTLARARGGRGVTPTLTASAVTVAQGAQITANAGAAGNGGSVTLLSAGTTDVSGRISAHGGSLGGNGGLVEISGQVVELGASIDLAAAAGLLGTLTLDPIDLVISDSLVAQGTTSVLTAADIEGINGNIVETAVHDITVASPIVLSTAGQGLTLDAGHDVVVNAGVTIDTAGAISFIAADAAQTTAGGVAATPDGTVRILNTAATTPTVVTTTGALSLSAGSTDISLGGAITAASLTLAAGAGLVQPATDPTSGNANVLTLSGSLSGSAGSISLQGANAIGTLGALSASSGGIAVTEAPGQALEVAATVATEAAGQTIALTADTITLGAGGALDAGTTGVVALAPATSGNALAVTDTAVGVGTLAVSLAELAQLTAGTLALGSADTGAISLGAAGEIIDLAADGIASLSLAGASAAEAGDATLRVGTLGGTLAGTAALIGSGNTIATLAGFSVGTGAFTLDTAGGLALTGELTAGTAELVVAGLLSESGGAIAATTLTGSAGTAALAGANSIATLAGFSVGTGAFTLDSAGDLALTGTLAAGTADLSVTGLLSESGGAIAATTLTGSAGTAALTGGNSIATLAGFSVGIGGFTLADTGSLTIADGLSAGTAIDISATGSLAVPGSLAAPAITLASQDTLSISGTLADGASAAATVSLAGAAGGTLTGSVNAASVTLGGGGFTDLGSGTLTAGTLAGTAAIAGDVVLTGTDAVGTLGGLSASGAFTLSDSTPLTIAGTLTAAPILLRDDSITFAATGLLDAGTGTVALAPYLSGDSQTLAGGGGGASVTAGTLRVGVDLTGVSLAGSLALPGTLDLSGASLIVLEATGNISQSGFIVQTGGTLTGTSGGDTTLNGTGNALPTLGNFTASGSFALTDTTGGISVIGTVSAGNSLALTASAGDIDIAGTLRGPDLVSLSAGGSVRETAGVISTPAGTLTGAAGGAVSLLSGGNAIGTLGSFSSQTGFALVDGQTLAVAGPVSDPSGIALTTTAGDLLLQGSLSTGQLGLTAPGNIAETAAASLTAGTLTGAAGGSLALALGINTIGTLAGFTSVGGFTLADGQALTVTGTVDSASADMLLSATGGLNLGTATAALMLGDTLVPTLTLLSTGNIAESSLAELAAVVLTGSAGGSVALSAGANTIATLAGFTFDGGFALADTTALTAAGPLQDSGAGTSDVLSIDVPGATLTVAGTLSAADITLSAGAITQTSGLVDATGTLDLIATGAILQSPAAGTLVADVLTGTAGGSVDLSQSGNAIANLASFAAGPGGFTLVDTLALTTIGTVSDPQLISLTTTGGLDLAGMLVAGTVSGGVLSGGTIALTAASIDQTGGAILADTLTGTVTAPAAAGTLDSNLNQIATLADVTVPGGFYFCDAVPLTIAGTVSGVGGVASAGPIILSDDSITFGPAGLLNAGTAGTVTLGALTAGDAMTVAGGSGAAGASSVDAGTLAIGSAAGSLALPGTLDLSGVATLDLLATGDISQPASAYVVLSDGPTFGTLEGSVGGNVLLAGTANVIPVLGSFTFGDTFELADAVALTVVGPLTGSGPGGSAIHLDLPGQALTLPGYLSATDIYLTAASITQTAGLVDATGTLSLVATSGAILQSPSASGYGTLEAGILIGSAAGSVDLSQGGNLIASLGSFAAGTTIAGTDFTLADTSDLTVVGTVTAPYQISLTTAGSLSLTGTLAAGTLAGGSLTGGVLSGASLTGGTIALAAAGIGQTSGAATADLLTVTLAGATASGSLDSITNAIATLGDVTAPGSFSFSDAVPLTFAGTITGAAGAASDGPVRLRDDSITVGTAALINVITTGTVELAPLQAGDGLTVAGGTGLAGASSVDAGTLMIGGTPGTLAGSLALDGTFNVSGVPTLDLLASGDITQPASDFVLLADGPGSLEGFSGGNVLLQGTGNVIPVLGSFTYGYGDTFALTDAVGLTVVGPVISGSPASGGGGGPSIITIDLPEPLVLAGDLTADDLYLTASSITQSAGLVHAIDTLDLIATSGAILQSPTASGAGTLWAGTLVGSALGSVDLSQSGNLIASLGSFAAGTATAGTDFILADTSDLTVFGTVTAPLGIALTTAGSLALTGTLAAGTYAGAMLTAGTLTGAALSGGTLVLSAATIDQTSGMLVADTLTGTLTAGTPGASAASADLGYATLSVSNGVTTTISNLIGTLDDFTVPGSFTLSDAANLTVVGTVSGAGGTASAGPLTLRDDSITFGTAALLNAGTAGTVALAPLTAGDTLTVAGGSGAAGVSSVNAGTLVVGETGTIAAGSLALSGTFNLSGVGTLDLLATGDINQGASGYIVLNNGTLMGSTSGTVTLTNTGDIFATLGNFSAGDTLSLANSDGGLTLPTGLAVAGIVSARDTVSLAVAASPGADGIDISGTISAGDEVSLLAAAEVQESGGLVATPGTLTGSAGTFVSLPSDGNAVGTLGPFSSRTGFEFTDGQTLKVIGPVTDPGSITLITAAGDLLLQGTVLTGAQTTPAIGTLTLDAAGNIAETAGTLTAGTLTGTAGGSVALDAGLNTLGTLDGFSSSGGFTLADAGGLTVTGSAADSASLGLSSAGPLTLAGSLTAPDIVLTVTPLAQGGVVTGTAASGSLQQTAGLVDAATVLSLNTSGAVTQTGGALQAATLTLTAGGSVALPQSANAVATLAGASSVGGLTLADGSSLAAAGTVTDTASLALTTSGSLALLGTLSAPRITLAAAGAISQPGGAILAGTLAGSGAAATLDSAANRISVLAGFAAPGGLQFRDAVALGVSGPVSASTIDLGVSGDLALDSTLTATLIRLTATGALTQPGGVMIAATLAGAAASATLADANSIATLADFATPGTLVLSDASALDVAGPVSAGAASLTVGGALTFSGDFATDGLHLAVAGGVVQQAGTLTVNALSGSAIGVVQLGQDAPGPVAAIAVLGPFSVAGGSSVLYLNDARDLVLQPTLAADAIGITAAGTVTLQSGTVTTGSAPGIGPAPAFDGVSSGATYTPPLDTSYIIATDTGGGAIFQQTGTTTINPSSGAGLRLQANGHGSISLANLEAPGISLILDAGLGASSGTLDAGHLAVVGSAGSADLTGLVEGFGGKVAARVSLIDPQPNRVYQLNGCPLESVNCVVLSSTAVPPPVLPSDLVIGAGSDDRPDPDLLLPNVANKDY